MNDPANEIVMTIARGIATITLTREAKCTALVHRHFVALAARLAEADADDSVGAIVLTDALTGEPINTSRAVEIGLIGHCVARADLDAAVATLASRLVGKPRAAIRAGLAAFSEMSDQVFEAAHAEAESRTFALAAARSP